MVRFTVKLPEISGKVVELSVYRDSIRGRQISSECPHTRCSLDAALTRLKCKDCDKELSPIEWIVMMGEYWQHVTRLFDGYVQAKAAYEGKARCRCEHCHKLTKVKPMTPAEIRKLKP